MIRGPIFHGLGVKNRFADVAKLVIEPMTQRMDDRRLPFAGYDDAATAMEQVRTSSSATKRIMRSSRARGSFAIASRLMGRINRSAALSVDYDAAFAAADSATVTLLSGKLIEPSPSHSTT